MLNDLQMSAVTCPQVRLHLRRCAVVTANLMQFFLEDCGPFSTPYSRPDVLTTYFFYPIFAMRRLEGVLIVRSSAGSDGSQLVMQRPEKKEEKLGGFSPRARALTLSRCHVFFTCEV